MKSLNSHWGYKEKQIGLFCSRGTVPFRKDRGIASDVSLCVASFEEVLWEHKETNSAKYIKKDFM